MTDDVRQHGLRESIVLYGNPPMVLDGRNRQLACEMAGVEPHYTVYEGDDPLRFIISKNLMRRHLRPSQVSFVALNIEEIEAEQAKKRTGRPSKNGGTNTTISEGGKARDIAARKTGASPRYISDAKRIHREAPELEAKIMAGEMNIPEAMKLLKSAGPTRTRTATRPKAKRTTESETSLDSAPTNDTNASSAPLAPTEPGADDDRPAQQLKPLAEVPQEKLEKKRAEIEVPRSTAAVDGMEQKINRRNKRRPPREYVEAVNDNSSNDGKNRPKTPPGDSSLTSASDAFRADLRALLEKYPAVCGFVAAWVSVNPNYSRTEQYRLPITLTGSLEKLGFGSSWLPEDMTPGAYTAVMRRLQFGLRCALGRAAWKDRRKLLFELLRPDIDNLNDA